MLFAYNEFILLCKRIVCDKMNSIKSFFFSGKCGHGSACEQLCYELHDGMYECECRSGFELNKDGYSCFGEFVTQNSPLSTYIHI